MYDSPVAFEHDCGPTGLVHREECFMTSVTARTPQEADVDGTPPPNGNYRDELLEKGILIDLGENGLYGRSQVFEDVLSHLDATVRRLGSDQRCEMLYFPPAMRRTDMEDSGYLKATPHEVGTIHSFCGDESGHQRLLRALDKAIAERDDDRDTEWMEQQKPTRLVLAPAACYPVYPLIARRGTCPADGHRLELTSYCFRQEPSLDPARMQMFRQHEYVRIGTPAQVTDFRQTWIERATLLAARLHLPAEIELANDPFFGRGGKILANNQRLQALKFELLIPIASQEHQTACASFNYHQDHMGARWKIRCEDGTTAHTGCVGFGLERLTLALFRHHGFDVQAWPTDVRTLLWGESGAPFGSALSAEAEIMP
jgi:seryl-tRNA synthetase